VCVRGKRSRRAACAHYRVTPPPAGKLDTPGLDDPLEDAEGPGVEDQLEPPADENGLEPPADEDGEAADPGEGGEPTDPDDLPAP